MLGTNHQQRRRVDRWLTGATATAGVLPGETRLERDAPGRVSGEGHVKRRYGYVRAAVGVLVLVSPPPWPVVGDGAAVAAQEPQAEAQTWTPPRTPDGHPDMQGHWDAVGGGSGTIEERLAAPSPLSLTGAIREARKSQIIDPPDGKVPYQPWALAQKQENVDQYIDPFANCFSSGVPRQVYSPRGHQLIQTPGRVLILSEWNHVYRVIPTDGRPHLSAQIRLWMGDSRGRWEGDTLVVDVTNHNGKAWLSVIGDFYTDALHVVERFTMVDADTIEYEVTLDDPNVYTRPWTMGFPWVRMEQGHETWEEPCHESDRDRPHFRNLGFKSYFGVTPPK